MFQNSLKSPTTSSDTYASRNRLDCMCYHENSYFEAHKNFPADAIKVNFNLYMYFIFTSLLKVFTFNTLVVKRFRSSTLCRSFIFSFNLLQTFRVSIHPLKSISFNASSIFHIKKFFCVPEKVSLVTLWKCLLE